MNAWVGATALVAALIRFATATYAGSHSAGGISSFPVSKHGPIGYHGPLAKPVVQKDGHLADTLEVAAARGEHLIAVAKAHSAAAAGYGGDDYSSSGSSGHGSIADPGYEGALHGIYSYGPATGDIYKGEYGYAGLQSFSTDSHGDSGATGYGVEAASYASGHDGGSAYNGDAGAGGYGAEASGHDGGSAYHGDAGAGGYGAEASGHDGGSAYHGDARAGGYGAEASGHDGGSAYHGDARAGGYGAEASGHDGGSAYHGDAGAGGYGAEASGLDGGSAYHGDAGAGGYGAEASGHDGGSAYHGPLAAPVVLKSGYLADTHDVAAAKGAHYVALSLASQHGAHH